METAFQILAYGLLAMIAILKIGHTIREIQLENEAAWFNDALCDRDDEEIK